MIALNILLGVVAAVWVKRTTSATSRSCSPSWP